ncbi:response regulator [Pelagibius sp. Alg239-R121]|uniref:response regulator n=1 Tax=Pelagibius sp. Alg239-R121 TaxID=2993448 RepID=UPI0024A78E9E|nr:response regulator [Pelagibius sp. Alg239-R121]
MKDLRWDRLTVLIVDDNRFIRELLTSVLKTLGVGKVIADVDGAAAIDRLKLSLEDPVSAGIGTVDLIISDWVMPQVDGKLFLRWIRTGPNVPDRFVPIVMISGAADREVVEDARDGGVTEFLAKPFASKTIADRLLMLVNTPRHYVLAAGYFGPDRRRTTVPVAEERRVTMREDIQFIRGPSSEKTLREDVRAIHFDLDDRLREKLGPDARKIPVAFDPVLIQAAEKRIQALVGDYGDWMERYLIAATEAQQTLQTGKGDPDQAIAKINEVAHELRGQGGIFDYPLITDVGKSLYKATKPTGHPPTKDRIKLIGAHIDTIRTVFKNKIVGDGGEVGTALLKEISEAVKRYQ